MGESRHLLVERTDHKGLCKPCETDETSCQRGGTVTMGGEQGNSRVKFVITELCRKWKWRKKEAGRCHRKTCLNQNTWDTIGEEKISRNV